jgi:hypothetical protein
MAGPQLPELGVGPQSGDERDGARVVQVGGHPQRRDVCPAIYGQSGNNPLHPSTAHTRSGHRRPAANISRVEDEHVDRGQEIGRGEADAQDDRVVPRAPARRRCG